MLRRAEALAPVVRRIVPVGVEDVVGLDDESWHRHDLIVGNEKVGALVRIAVIDGAWANVWGEAADRHSLPEIGFGGAEPTRVAIPGLGAVMQHHTVMGDSCVGPVEDAEERLAAEHHILTTGLHAQALESGEVPDQHVGSSDPQCAAVAPAIGCRTPVMIPRIVLETPGTIRGVSAPGPRPAAPCRNSRPARDRVRNPTASSVGHSFRLLYQERRLGRGLAGERVTVPGGTIHDAAEAGLVPYFRPHAEVGAHPELLEIELFPIF